MKFLTVFSKYFSSEFLKFSKNTKCKKVRLEPVEGVFVGVFVSVTHLFKLL
jgi:hypothetical protein